MFCPSCGTKIPDNAKFCGACGKIIPVQPAQRADNNNQPMQTEAPAAQVAPVAQVAPAAQSAQTAAAAQTTPVHPAPYASGITEGIQALGNITEVQPVQAAPQQTSAVVRAPKNKRRTRIISIIIAGALCCAVAAAIIIISVNNAGGTGNISDLLDAASRYLAEMNYEQAIIEFDKVLAVDPANAAAYIGKAKAYHAMGDLDKAIETLTIGYEKTGDDEILSLLNDYSREINPVITESTTSSTASEPAADSAEEDDDELRLSWTDIPETLDSKGFGILTNSDDSSVWFSDENGERADDKSYNKIYHCVGTEDKHYCVAKRQDGTAVVLDKDLNILFELPQIDYFSWINGDEDPLLVCFNIRDYEVEGSKDYIKIYKPDGKLLYSWEENQALDGSGKAEYYGDPLLPDGMWTVDCHYEEFHTGFYVDSVATGFGVNPTFIGDKMYITFSVSVKWEYDHDAEEKLRQEAEERKRREAQEAGGGVWVTSIVSDAHHCSAYPVFDVNYDGSAVTLIPVELSGNTVNTSYVVTNIPKIYHKEDDDVIYGSRTAYEIKSFYKEKNGTVTGFCYSLQEYWDNSAAATFGDIIAFPDDDLMIGIKYADDENSENTYALFRPKWDAKNENGETEFPITSTNDFERISDYYTNIITLESMPDVLLVSSGDRWGYISVLNGEEILMADDATEFAGGYAIVSSGGMGHIIDKEFNVVSGDFPCDSAIMYDDCFRVCTDGKYRLLKIEP